MKPIRFDEANVLYAASDDWDELPAMQMDAPQNVVSVWEPTHEERIAIAEGGNVEIAVMGTSQPPISVNVYKVTGWIGYDERANSNPLQPGD